MKNYTEITHLSMIINCLVNCIGLSGMKFSDEEIEELASKDS